MDQYNEHCCFIKIDEKAPSCIRRDQVHELSNLQKKSLFSDAFSRYQARGPETQAVLERLRQLCPSTAARFGSKSSRVQDFPFRLVSRASSDFSAECLTYFTLSYRWSQLHDSETHGEFSLPVPPLLWVAVIRELRSSHEGIWIDQICIDQNNMTEKSLSIGLMDMIYEQARRVIIPIHDVELTSEEIACLESVIPEYLSASGNTASQYPFDDPNTIGFHQRASPEYMAQTPMLCAIYDKLFASEYFQRAWCIHEFQLSSKHVLLILCREEGLVLRISNGFLAELDTLRLSLRERLRYRAREYLHAHNNIRYAIRRGITQPGRVQPTKAGLLEIGMLIGQLKASGDNDPYLLQKQRIQTAMRDKVAITLNSSGSNIVLLPKIDAWLDAPEQDIDLEYNRILNLLGLATKEASVLCCSGAALTGRLDSDSFSWTRVYDHGDMQANIAPMESTTAWDIHLCQSDTHKFIELPLSIFLPILKCVPRHWVRLAGAITRGMLLYYGDDSLETPFMHWRGFWNLGSQLVPVYLETFACVLHLGFKWLVDCISLQPFAPATVSRATILLEPFENDRGIFPDLDSLPATTSEALDHVTHEIAAWTQMTTGHVAAVECVMSFTGTLMLFRPGGDPNDWTAQPTRSHRPFMMSLDAGASFQHLIFRNHIHFRAQHVSRPIAIPSILLGDRYHQSRRCWTVDWAMIEGERQMSLLGRTSVIGPYLNLAGVEAKLTKVYGSPKARSQMIDHGPTIWSGK